MEDTMQKWCDWLGEMKKKDERKKMEELSEQKVSQMIKMRMAVLGSCTRSQGHQHGEEGRRS